MKTGIAVTGYPAAGKSQAGHILADRLNAIRYETGDIVRREAAKYFDQGVEDLTSDELGEYSTMRRQTDGGDYVMQDVFDYLEENPQYPEQPVVISGMRDSEVPQLCRERFDRFLLVWIESSFQTRLERLQRRGRQDESAFTEEDLRQRDEREDQWGTGDLYEQRDVVIENNGSMEMLHQRLNAVEYLL